MQSAQMKGTIIVLTQGETYNQRKDSIWSYIHTSQDLIRAIQNTSICDSQLAKEVIAEEKAIIRDSYAELKELALWVRSIGLEPDEPFDRRKEGKNGTTK